MAPARNIHPEREIDYYDGSGQGKKAKKKRLGKER